MKMKNLKKLMACVLSAGMLTSLVATPGSLRDVGNVSIVEAAGVKAHSVRTLTEIADIDYAESLSETPNPDRGFYKSERLSYVKGNSNKAVNMKAYKNSMAHLRIDLSDFAAHDKDHGGPTSDVLINSSTTNLLTALDGTLQSLRENNGTAVVRIAYDKNYAGYTKDTLKKKDDGTEEWKEQSVFEPSIDTVLQHQQAIGEVFAKYPDVISSVECGVFGPWGEMHHSNIMTDENLSKVINKWLEVLPQSMTITVRQPEFYAKWCGCGITDIDSNITSAGNAAYRVGAFNDGYLGSYSDRGTFRDREKEVTWLSNQAKHTLYGGEIVLFDNSEGVSTEVRPNGLYMEKEAFRTHTSYLNIGWNDEIIANMKKTVFKGQDPLYNNGTSTEFNYVQNHLGYRFVVRNVKLTRETSKYENFALETEIENVGFANVIKEKKAYLIIKSEDGQFEKSYDLGALDASKAESASNVDPRNWDSTTKTTVKVNVDIPDDFAIGKYWVYIKLVTDTTNNNYGTYPIRFSNNDAYIYDENLEANYLGSFAIVEATLDDGTSDNGNSGNGNNGVNGTSENPAAVEIKDNNNQNNSNNQSNNQSNNTSGNGASSSTSGGAATGDSASTGTTAGGTSYSSEWVDGKWYNADGTQTYEGTLAWKCNSTGWWAEDTAGWYPVSQWQKIDGKWYYFTSSGYMDYSEYRDGCWLGSDGAWVEGYSGGHWCKNSKGWWYEDNSGWYPSNQYLWIDGTEYFFKSNGYMK